MASRNCCKVQAAVGWAVTLQCKIRRLPTSMTTNTYSTRNLAVMATKKITGHYDLSVIANKRPPVLRGCSPTASRITILRPGAKKAGVEGAELHRHRKTYADTLHEEGVSVNTIRIRLGHESLDVTLAYLKGKDAESEEAQEHANSSSLALYA